MKHDDFDLGRLFEESVPEERLLACEDIASGVRLVAAQAVDALWNFYNRPLPDGVRWAQSVEFENLAAFTTDVAGDPDRLAETCREVSKFSHATAAEKKALMAFAGAFDGLTLKPEHCIKGESSVFSGFTKDSCENAMEEHRSGTRSETAQRAYFRLNDVQYTVTVRNLSEHGAMIEGPRGLEVGARASVQLLRAEWVDGTIRWSVEDRSGIEFDHE